MKSKFLLTVAMLLAAGATFGQERTSPRERDFGLGIRAGLNFNQMYTKAGDQRSIAGIRTSVHAGLSYQLPVWSNLFLESGLYYTNKGYAGSASGLYNGQVVALSYPVRMQYLEVPLLAGYRFRIADGTGIAPFVGGYFAYGLSATAKLPDNSKADLLSDPQKYIRSDAGLRAGVQYNVSKFVLSAAYEYGLLNLLKDPATNASEHSSCWTISLGYNF